MKRILHTIMLLLIAIGTFAQSYPRKCTEEDIPSSERKKYFEQVENSVQNFYMLLLELTNQETRDEFISEIFMDDSSKHIPEFYLDGQKNVRLSPGQYLIELDKVVSAFDREGLEFSTDNFSHDKDMYMMNMRSCYVFTEYDLTLKDKDKVVFKRRCKIVSFFPKASSHIRVKIMQIEPVKDIIAYKKNETRTTVADNNQQTMVHVSGVITDDSSLDDNIVVTDNTQNVKNQNTKTSSSISNFQNKHYTYQIFQKAENGDAHAQYELGLWYYYGKNVEKSHIDAFKWYSRAAEQEHIEAKMAVAKCYYYGKGVNKSYKKAYDLFESVTRIENQSAVNKEAVYFLAWMQEHGQGCEVYLIKAVENYQKCGIYRDAPDRILQLLDKNDFLKYLTTKIHKKGHQSCNGTVYATEKNGKTDILIGAVVLVVGSDIGIVTNIDGNFNLTGLKPGDIICSSFIGYENFYYEWKEGDEKKHHKFILKAKQ